MTLKPDPREISLNKSIIIKVNSRTFKFKSTDDLVHLRNWLLDDPKAFAEVFDRKILQPMMIMPLPRLMMIPRPRKPRKNIWKRNTVRAAQRTDTPGYLKPKVQ